MDKYVNKPTVDILYEDDNMVIEKAEQPLLNFVEEEFTCSTRATVTRMNGQG